MRKWLGRRTVDLEEEGGLKTRGSPGDVGVACEPGR
jgi:hypothetical protein